MNTYRSRLAAALGLMAAMPLAAAVDKVECTASSPDHTVALLELYTSEGCSSCPPADRWLGRLRSADLAGKLVPLALHVGYWDYIGWKDRFAKPAFAARQRQLVSHAGDGAVYTPQFFLQGRPVGPSAATAAFERQLAAFAQRPAAADIALQLAPVADGMFTARIAARLRAPHGEKAADLIVALFQNSLSSTVSAGENSGVTLHHDFVVREWRGPIPLSSGAMAETSIEFALPSGEPIDSFGLAAFVAERSTLAILQALARPLCH